MSRYHFLICNEDPKSGLLISQLITPVKEQFRLPAKIWLINRLGSEKSEDSSIGALPLLIPARIFAYNALCFFYLPWALLLAGILRSRFDRDEQDVVVARGYIAGLIAWGLYAVFRIKYVFDPRSIYPLECVTAGRMKRSSIAFKFWLFAEWLIVRRSSKVMCVSHGMKKYYRRRYGYKKAEVVPCFYESQITASRSDIRTEVMDKLGLDKSKILIIYYGSLNNGWNNVQYYSNLVERFDARRHEFLFVSQDYTSLSESSLAASENVTIFAMDCLPLGVTLGELFRSADFGILCMEKNLDWYTRLSVKFANYVSAGLPVIVNRWVGEASRLIRVAELPGCKVLRTPSDIAGLKPASDAERTELKNWGLQYFDNGQINKVII